MRLERFKPYENQSYGIFGKLFDDKDALMCFTLEHAYPAYPGWDAKVPDGAYTCQRGKHAIPDHKGGVFYFETFEVTGVPGHSGILFHVGNYNVDSDGCILLGQEIRNMRLVTSQKAFEQFMQAQDGKDSFQLQVVTTSSEK